MKKILLGLTFLIVSNFIAAQNIVCDVGDQTYYCSKSITLEIEQEENITVKLEKALLEYCEIRIPNNGKKHIMYLVNPMTFSGDLNNKNTSLQDRTIILEEGVVLQTTEGSSSYCSQSMFTFDGEANRNITIIGEYEDCIRRPGIRMPKVEYKQDSLMGYLVASDDKNEPYLNDNNMPNYVYDDGDMVDPYFDDNGNPNLITPQNQKPKVPASCDYNYNLCNRDIIVWCPLNWEGRHLIAIHGAQQITIQGINIENSSGGDGIILAASESGAPSKNILIDDIHFYRNGRTGLNVKSAVCVQTERCYIEKTGDQAGIHQFVDVNGAVAFEPLEDEENLEYFMKNIYFKNSSIADNYFYGIKFNFPSLIDTTYQPELEVEIDGVCITDSDFGILFDSTDVELEGKIYIANTQISDVETALLTTANWQSKYVKIELLNLDMSQDIFVDDVNIDPLSNFCSNLQAKDVCMAYSTAICGQNPGCDYSDNNTCLGNGEISCIPTIHVTCPVECETKYDLHACYNQPQVLEAKIDIDDILADRPLSFTGWRNELNTDYCGLNGDVELCFDFSDEEGRTIQVLGLNSDPSTNTHFNSIDYGIYLLKLNNGTHRIRIYQNGGLAYSQNTGVNLVGTQFCIKRENGKVTYLRDGVVFYTSTVQSDELLYFDNSFYSQNSNVWSQGLSEFTNITYRITANPSLVWSPGGATGPTLTVSTTENAVYTASFLNGSAEGCENSFRFNLTVVDTPALTPIIVDPNLAVLENGTEVTICDGEQVILSFEEYLAGNLSYTYDWSTPATAGATLPIGLAGTYSVTITDTLGCTQFVEFTVHVDPLPDVTLLGGHLDCIVTSVDITGPAGFNYDPPLPYSVSAPGEYCFLVTDPITGCSIQECATVTQDIVHPELECEIGYTDITGNFTSLDQCDISICPDECVVLAAQGSNLSFFNYEWSSNVNAGNDPWETESLCNISDAYSVTITNPVNGCTQVLDFNVNVDPSPDVTLTGGHLTCVVTSVDITGPSGYLYDPALPLAVSDPGLYCVVVTDPSTGCTAEECVTVTQNIVVPDLACQINYTDINGNNSSLNQCNISICPDECVVLAAQGNNLAGFNYQWSSNVAAGNVPWETEVLCNTAGSFSLTITDPANGCFQVLEFNVNVDPTPDVTLTGGHLTCAVTSVDITGPAGFQYNPALPLTVSNPGEYCFVVTDPITGCTAEECVVVTQDIVVPDLDCQISHTDGDGNTAVLDQCNITICSDGCLTLSAQGNNLSSYEYQWSLNIGAGNNPWESEEICNDPGTYTLIITDPDNQCRQVLTFVVAVDPLPNVTLTGGELTCDVTSVNITGPSGFQYSPSLPFAATTPGEYCFEVTDPATGCSTEACATVTEDVEEPNFECEINFTDENGTPMELNSCSISNCPGDCVQLEVHGNNLSAFTYSWSNNVTVGANPWITNDICGPGTYSVTVTDPTNGCTQELEFTVTEDGDCMTLCNAGNLSPSGGDEETCVDFPGLQAGQNICWRFNPQSIPDQLTISIGGVIILDTGLISNDDGDCDDCGGCNVTVIDEFHEGDCIELPIGFGVAEFVGNGSTLQLHGTIPITSALEFQDIQVCIDGTICDDDTAWSAFVECCESPGPCVPDPTTGEPFNQACIVSDNGSAIIWNQVNDADYYEVIIDPNRSSCCPDVPTNPELPVIVASTTGSSLPLLPSLPDCYTYLIVAYDANGDVLSTSNEGCMNDDTECSEVDPPPCEGPTAPTDIECESIDGVTSITFSSTTNNSIGHTITIQLGGPCCPEGGDNSVHIFQVTGGKSFTIPPELAGRCFSLTVTAWCIDFSSATSETICYDPEEGCRPEGGKKERSVDFVEQSEKAFNVFPNPATDVINLSFENFVTELTDITIEIINNQSQVMRTIEVSIDRGDENISIDTDQLTSGMYFIKVRNDKANEVYIQKVVLIK